MKFLAEVDQCDVYISVTAEAAFRDMQTIEYSYQDKLRDLESSGGGGGQAGRLSTEQQSMFAGSSRLSQSLMVCPALLKLVTQEVDKEGGYSKTWSKPGRRGQPSGRSSRWGVEVCSPSTPPFLEPPCSAACALSRGA